MSVEKEFKLWLNRQNKSVLENFQFALKAWISAEFALPSKYDHIIHYFNENSTEIFQNDENNFENITKFVQLKCVTPGLINMSTKSNAISIFIKFGKKNKQFDNRKIMEILFQVIQQDIYQDFFKLNYDKFCTIYGVLFRQYPKYLESNYANNKNFQTSYENEFMKEIINHFIEFVKRLQESDIEKFSKEFSKETLKSLVEVVILLKSKNLKFFDEILEIEKILFVEYEKTFLRHHLMYPIHVNLVNFECGLINFRDNVKFYEKFFSVIFHDFQDSSEFSSPNIFLIILSYILEMLKKYDVKLNITYEDQTALQYLNKKIEWFVDNYYQSNLYEILCLLCSTIRLNPLILEHNIFGIAAKILVAPKTKKDLEKFEEFLIIFLDMFQKLQRPLKFISILLKSIQNHLNVNMLSKKLKHKLKIDGEPSAKKVKLENDEIFTVCNDEDKHIETSNVYIKILLENLERNLVVANSVPLTNSVNFSHISFAWPSSTVSEAFSRFIGCLMVRPSLGIWKTLILNLNDHVEMLASKTSAEINENILFSIDFISALLCEFLAATRLIEQPESCWENNRNLMKDLLKKFGQALLHVEHNNRTMNAFLQIIYHLGMFNLISWYYFSDLPTSNSIDNLKNMKSMHDFLTDDEWTIIQQRIVNFGNKDCKLIMNRICVQNIKGKLLFQETTDTNLNDNLSNNSNNLKNYLLSSTLSDPEQMKIIFKDPLNFWLVKHLTEEHKFEICKLIVEESLENESLEDLQHFLDSQDLVNIIILEFYRNASKCFSSKKSLLASINFESLKHSNLDNEKIVEIFDLVNKSDGNNSINKYSEEKLTKIIKLMQQLPTGFVNTDFKMILFGLHLALYRDVLATGNEDLINITFEICENIIRFGKNLEIFKFCRIEKLLQIFIPSKSLKFYEFMFNTVLKKKSEITATFLTTIMDILEAEDELSTDNLNILIILLEALYLYKRLFHSHFERLTKIYGNYVNKFFANDERNFNDDQIFVAKTIQAFSIYMKILLGKTKRDEEIDESFRKMCKIYIGHSIDVHNAHAVKLMRFALSNRIQLHFDLDEIQLVMEKYWDQLKHHYESENSEDLKSSHYANAFIFIVMYKSNADFRNILSDIGKGITIKNLNSKCQLLKKIAQCMMPDLKGPIFNEQFKNFIFEANLILRPESSSNQLEVTKIRLTLISTITVVCSNSHISVSVDHMDNILTFLTDINIKNFVINESNVEIFKELHIKMSNLCTVMLKHRSRFIMDRIPQFVYIFRDLLQAVCCYKSEREKDVALLPNVIDDLAELAQKLESLMHIIVSHKIDVKRVAPYLLTFTINLMVTNNRSTTVYQKIKQPVDNICYDLISICDHRVNGFILRCSNDATKLVYETLCKEYDKYHKFKGKV